MPRSLNEIIKAAHRSFSSVINSLLYLGPLRSYPPRLVHAVAEKDANWQSGGALAWNIVLKNGEVRSRVNEWLSDPKRLSTPYQLKVDSLYRIDQWMDAFRRQLSEPELGKLRAEVSNILKSLESLEDQKREQAITSDQTGEGLKGLLARLSKPLTEKGKKIEDAKEPFIPIDAALDFGYDVGEFIDTYMVELASTLTLDVESKDFLSMVDRRTNTIVSHRDVGVGISQVLPVLVYAFAHKERLIAIEQPEIHLHPQLQAELGDVFIQSALGENKNTLILETHSEHLILRILRRIRETSDGTIEDKRYSIKAEDVQVLYVQPSPTGSIIHKLEITRDGEFTTKWPEGFFAERAKELF